MSFDWPNAKNEARERFGDDFENLHLDSRLLSSRNVILPNADPVVVPIYHSSTYRYKTVNQFNESNHGSNYVYQRCGNPTVENVEVVLQELEGSAATLLYNSGLAACQAVILEFLNAGDHLICMKPMYSGSYSFLTETMTRFGVQLTFVDVENEENFEAAVEKAIKSNTKMIFVEALANPSMAAPDVIGIIAIAQKHKLFSVIDGTFASPYLLQSVKLGADFSVHSCSKYIGGHTDVIAGCVSTKSIDHWRRLKLQQLTTGSACSAFDASLLSRGLKTLALRVDRISDNALAVAKYLESHSKVVRVYYAGLESHPKHSALKKYLPKFGGMIGFDVGTSEAAVIVAENVRLIIHAVSLGGCESLIEHPASMSHGAQLLRDDNAPRVSPGLLRFSVGVENVNDIIADLERALALIP